MHPEDKAESDRREKGRKRGFDYLPVNIPKDDAWP